MAIWRMRIAFWMPKATDTHSEHVIRIAIPLQQWWHEHASLSRYTYIASLVGRRMLQLHGNYSYIFSCVCDIQLSNASLRVILTLLPIIMYCPPVHFRVSSVVSYQVYFCIRIALFSSCRFLNAKFFSI